MNENGKKTASELLNEYFAAFSSGEKEAALSLFSEEVDFNVPGSLTVPWTGRREHDEILDFLDHAIDDVTTEAFVVEKIFGSDDEIVAFGSFRHLVIATGKPFESLFALRVESDGDRITKYHMFEDSSGARDAFTSDEAGSEE